MREIIAWLKSKIPTRESLQKERIVRYLQPILNRSPEYWAFDRSSVSRGVALGIFGMLMPFPFQLMLVLLLAIPARANLILSLGLVWLNTPLTMVPLYVFSYKVGAKILGETIRPVDMHLSWKSLVTELRDIWKPFLLGCTVCGVVAGLAAWAIVYFGWRYFEEYEAYRKARAAEKNSPK